MSFSAHRGSYSRLSQMLRRPQSPSTDDRSVVTEPEAPRDYSGGSNDSRPRNLSRPRLESSAGVVGSLSSSMKTPARSYYQRSFYGSNGNVFEDPEFLTANNYL